MGSAIRDPEYVTLAKLLNGRLFRIPEYQRYYRWGRDQRDDLFDDVRKSQEQGRPHFMATINVYDRNEPLNIGTDEYVQYDVVDGQQRLTTLVILLKAIAVTSRTHRQDDECQRIADELESLLVKGDQYRTVLLQTNHKSRELFQDYLSKGASPTTGQQDVLATKAMADAIRGCRDFVQTWVDGRKGESIGTSLTNLVSHLKNRLTFILHAVGQKEHVYTVFEVLNSRGLLVSWLDRLKSMLMDRACTTDGGDTLVQELEGIWAEIYRVMGLRDLGPEVVRFSGILHTGVKELSEEGSVRRLLQHVDDGPDPERAARIREIAQLILNVTRASDRTNADLERRAVLDIAQVRIVAAASTEWLSPEYTVDERRAIERKWENVAFRIFGLARRDARVHKGEFTDIAKRMWQQEDPQTILRGLDAIGSGEYGVATVVDNLRNKKVYGWWLSNSELGYLLYKYEEYLARERRSWDRELAAAWKKVWTQGPEQSIEHISPQSAGEEWMDRLGNLLLIPLKVNKELQDKSPKVKARDVYKPCGGQSARDVADRIMRNGGKWTLRDVVWRERKLLRWAKQQWAE